MEIYPCNCSWDVPGVESLPNHTHHWSSRWYNPTDDKELVVGCHPDMGRPGDPDWILMQIDESVSIWLNYRALSRAYADLL